MKELDINISGLKVGAHFYEFRINKALFDAFNEGMVEGADLEVDLKLKKSETMIEAQFDIHGEVVLVCDRSLEEFTEPIHLSQRIFFKFAAQADELSDELELIPFQQASIDFSSYLYEYVALAIPIKKLHPRFRAEMERLEEEALLVYSSEANGPLGEDDTDGNDESADPRWEALKRLRDN